MTEPPPRTDSAVASRDYWDLVLHQLRRKATVWVSVPLLVLLYAVAIYAPCSQCTPMASPAIAVRITCPANHPIQKLIPTQHKLVLVSRESFGRSG